MMRSRGFSLLEAMLALIVVAIGISVLLTFSTSSKRETANKGVGNDYSVIVNHVLEEFLDARDDCSSSATNCDLLKDTNLQNAGDYLARYHSTTLSSTQKEVINATGIQVTIQSCRSDEEQTSGSCAS